MENFIPLEEGFTIFVSCWGKGFYNRRCWAILLITGDPSSLCSDELVPTLRCSQSIHSMKTFFPSCLFFFFFCQTACWEFQFIPPTAPRRAECAPGVFKQQPEGNTGPAKVSWETDWQSAALLPLGRLFTVLGNGHTMAQASPTTPVKPSTCISGCLPQQHHHPGTLQGRLFCPLLPSSGHSEN